MKLLLVSLFKRAVFALPLLAVAFAGQARATTYYLSITGSDSYSGSFASPWSSINRAMLTMTSNDDLQLRGGTYYYPTIQKISKGGTSARWMSIGSYNGERAVLDFSTQPRVLFSSTQYAGLGIEAQYLYLYNLTVQYSWAGHGISGNSSNVTVQGCEVYYCGGAGITFAHPNYNTTKDRLDNITIQSCKVSRCVQANNPGSPTYHSAWRTSNGGWPYALGVSTGNNAKILSCSSWENYGEGMTLLRCAGAGIDFSNNWAATNWGTNLYLDNVYGSQATYARVAYNLTNNSNGSAYANFKRNGNNAAGITVAQEDYGSRTTGSFWIQLNQNQVQNSGNGFVLAEYTSPVSYIQMYGNKALTSTYNGYLQNSGNTNITWSTNYVNSTATTGSQPYGK
jgi:hypothetical protein